MRSLGFLVSRRWVLFAIVVALLAWGTWWLGEWQFHRLSDRKHDNAVIARNEASAPARVDDVMARGRPVSPDDEWRTVVARGTYVPEDSVVVRYRSQDGEAGVDVVVPLLLDDGTSLLVDRGFWQTDDNEPPISSLPAPPSGEVTVEGWVRVDGTGDSTEVTDQSTRSIASGPIGRAIGRPVYGGFVDLRSEDPAPRTPLMRTDLPELDNGPHFFYGLQWWFFGVLALFGFGYLAFDEARGGPQRDRRRPGQSARSIPPSTGSMAPDTNDAAGDSRNAAARPNSSGSP
ncbi:MAG TPA: SURF1 family protein [Nocardioides sp.]|nr:SURF1 family protein [Nocardioides sp.]